MHPADEICCVIRELSAQHYNKNVFINRWTTLLTSAWCTHVASQTINSTWRGEIQSKSLQKFRIIKIAFFQRSFAVVISFVVLFSPCPRVSGENAHRKRTFSKALTSPCRAGIFENCVFVFLCGHLNRECLETMTSRGWIQRPSLWTTQSISVGVFMR